jgi:hypothetical protein
MGFPLEVFGVGKKQTIEIIHIKYVYNMYLKTEIDDRDGNISKRNKWKPKSHVESKSWSTW